MGGAFTIIKYWIGSKKKLKIIVELIEAGVNPDALAVAVKEIFREGKKRLQQKETTKLLFDHSELAAVDPRLD